MRLYQVQGVVTLRRTVAEENNHETSMDEYIDATDLPDLLSLIQMKLGSVSWDLSDLKIQMFQSQGPMLVIRKVHKLDIVEAEATDETD